MEQQSRGKSAPVKITPPRLAACLPRRRIISSLDEACERSGVWISGPPGMGKTWAVASYLQDSGKKSLWYQMDERDADPASFFHYLGLAIQQAAPGKLETLPHLTPEYLADIVTFGRNFFEQLYGVLNPPFVLVFDNYQLVSADAPLHKLLEVAVASLPDGGCIMMISRNEPPAEFARLQASQLMARVDWQTLKFTLEETEALGHLLGKGELSAETIKALNETFQGWVAGIVLQLQQATAALPENISYGENHELVFNYLAEEIFNQMSAYEQDILLKSALLPQMSESMLTGLTGVKSSVNLLRKLNSQGYFTTHHLLPLETYQYHPLFREFLLAKGRELFTAEKLEYLQRQAADLLSRNGSFEEAVDLLNKAGAMDELTALILEHAPDLAAHGRHQTLYKLLSNIPAKQHEHNPWIVYWLAVARAPYAPFEAREYFEQAFKQFRKVEDASGIYLSWCGIVGTFLYMWDDIGPLINWLSELEKIQHEYPDYPDDRIEAQVVHAAFSASVFVCQDYTTLAKWLERVEYYLHYSQDKNYKAMLSATLALHYAWTGEFGKLETVIDSFRSLIGEGPISPLAEIQFYLAKAQYCWLTNKCDAGQTVKKGLACGRQSGVHISDAILLSQAVYAAGNKGDHTTFERYLTQLESLVNETGRLNLSHFYYQTAWLAALQQNSQRAYEYLLKSHLLNKILKSTIPTDLTRIALAQMYAERGEFGKAQVNVDESRKFCKARKARFDEFFCEITQAWLYYLQDDIKACKHALQVAFRLGKAGKYFTSLFWRPEVITNLCLVALEHGIEVEYVQQMIRENHLLPQSPPLHLDNWPWQIKIYTLGRFSLVVNNEVVRPSGKGKKKPLEMLKALIAFGGREVAEEKLSEALWPDAEGDSAHRSFATTLHRLRKLLGNDALQLHDGRLSLNDRHVWVDVWAFERLMTQLTEQKNDDIDALNLMLDKAYALYEGAFLGREGNPAWSLSMQERLLNRWLSVLKKTAQRYAGRGQNQRIIDLYEHAIALDDLVEAPYLGLMKVYASQGDNAEALKVYQQCAARLQSGLEIEPSENIRALYQAIKNNDKAKLKVLCKPYSQPAKQKSTATSAT